MLENNVERPSRTRENALNVLQTEFWPRISRHSRHLYIDNFGKEEKGTRESERDEGEDGRAIALYRRTLRTSAIDLSDLINENSRTRSIRFNYAGT